MKQMRNTCMEWYAVAVSEGASYAINFGRLLIVSSIQKLVNHLNSILHFANAGGVAFLYQLLS